MHTCTDSRSLHSNSRWLFVLWYVDSDGTVCCVRRPLLDVLKGEGMKLIMFIVAWARGRICPEICYISKYRWQRCCKTKHHYGACCFNSHYGED